MAADGSYPTPRPAPGGGEEPLGLAPMDTLLSQQKAPAASQQPPKTPSLTPTDVMPVTPTQEAASSQQAYDSLSLSQLPVPNTPSLGTPVRALRHDAAPSAMMPLSQAAGAASMFNESRPRTPPRSLLSQPSATPSRPKQEGASGSQYIAEFLDDSAAFGFDPNAPSPLQDDASARPPATPVASHVDTKHAVASANPPPKVVPPRKSTASGSGGAPAVQAAAVTAGVLSGAEEQGGYTLTVGGPLRSAETNPPGAPSSFLEGAGPLSVVFAAWDEKKKWPKYTKPFVFSPALLATVYKHAPLKLLRVCEFGTEAMARFYSSFARTFGAQTVAVELPSTSAALGNASALSSTTAQQFAFRHLKDNATEGDIEGALTCVASVLAASAAVERTWVSFSSTTLKDTKASDSGASVIAGLRKSFEHLNKVTFEFIRWPLLGKVLFGDKPNRAVYHAVVARPNDFGEFFEFCKSATAVSSGVARQLHVHGLSVTDLQKLITNNLNNLKLIGGDAKQPEKATITISMAGDSSEPANTVRILNTLQSLFKIEYKENNPCVLYKNVVG